MATIRGSVFYNDQREHGLFSQRRYSDGSNGQQCRAAGKVPDCSDTAQRLSGARAERGRKQAELDSGSLQGNDFKLALQALANLDRQIAAEQASLGRCQQFCGLNWLGGYYMVVDVIERDDGFLPTDSNCKREEVLTSATVGRGGSYTATFSTADPCNHDKLGGTAITLRVRLQFHNDKYAFSINSERNRPYALEQPRRAERQATTCERRRRHHGQPPQLQHGLRSARAEQRLDRGQLLRVDRRHHHHAAPRQPDTVLPRRVRRAAVRLPVASQLVGVGHRAVAHPSGDLELLEPARRRQRPLRVDRGRRAGARVRARDDAARVGRLVRLRRHRRHRRVRREGVSAACLQGGLGEFVKHVVFKDSLGCQRPGYDANGIRPCSDIAQRLSGLRAERGRTQAEFDSGSLQGNDAKLALQALADLDGQIAAEEAKRAECRREGGYTALGSAGEAEEDANLKGALGEGASWRDNVVKALCDWYDSTDDNDPDAAGPGDHFAAEDIHSMWSNLRNMYLEADKYGGQYKNPGLWFCDYVRYYLDVRKSAAAVGAKEHANYENSIRDLIDNNNIGCSMSSPG
jgi:hypothetical protein